MQRRVEVAARSAMQVKQRRQWTNFIIPPLFDFPRGFRIGQELAGHIDDVRLARSDDFYHHFRVGQAADGGDGFMHMLLDFRSQEDVPAMILEHGRMGDAKRFLVRTGRNVDDIHVRFDGLGNPYALGQIVAAPL